MQRTTKHLCPGCGRYFLPGGYTNHLKLTHDPRCKSIQNSVFRSSSSAPSQNLGLTPTPRPSPTLSPMPGPSSTPELLDFDVEMVDIASESQDHLTTHSNVNPPSPSQSVGDSGDNIDGEGAPDELFGTPPNFLSSVPIIIGSDMDSDLSDEDGGETHRLHHQEPIAPPGRSFRSGRIANLY